jgi:hypothetical protein
MPELRRLEVRVMMTPKAPCILGGLRRPGILIHGSHRRRAAVDAAELSDIDALKERLHCHRSRSLLVFRIQ